MSLVSCLASSPVFGALLPFLFLLYLFCFSFLSVFSIVISIGYVLLLLLFYHRVFLLHPSSTLRSFNQSPLPVHSPLLLSVLFLFGSLLVLLYSCLFVHAFFLLQSHFYGHIVLQHLVTCNLLYCYSHHFFFAQLHPNVRSSTFTHFAKIRSNKEKSAQIVLTRFFSLFHTATPTASTSCKRKSCAPPVEEGDSRAYS